MSFNTELACFAAHLRRFIEGSTNGSLPDPAAFDEQALALFALQFKHNGPYRQLCEAKGARPATVTDWTAIPAVPTSAFKEFELTCLPAGERRSVFHSSGTTAQRPSRHYHNGESLAVYEASLLAWFITNLKSPISNLSLAILTPPPVAAPHSSLVHMFDTIRRKAGLDETVFLGQAAGDGGWRVDLEAVLERLRNVSAAERPLMVFGTAFSFVHLLDHLAERGLRFALPAGSYALETGGYKGRSRSLPKPALHALISRHLGIPFDRIVCEYGMSELSSQAYDCALGPSRITHHASRIFRFPPWARAEIISPETGRQVGEGETGLIRVFDLANVYSVMAIQTEDLGIRAGDGFALAGRAALAEPRGCSLMAL